MLEPVKRAWNFSDRGHGLPVGSRSIDGRAALKKTALIVEDITQSAAFLPDPFVLHTRSEAAIPLMAGGRVLGVLNMQAEQPGP